MTYRTQRRVALGVLGFIFGVMLYASNAHADTKISALPAAAAITGTEAVPAVQSAATVRTTPAALDVYVKANGAVLIMAKGGTGQSTSPDDNVLVGNGTLWQLKTMPTCSATDSALTYNLSTNGFGCNSTAAASLSGSFTGTATQGFTTTPSTTFTYRITGGIVTICNNAVVSGTSNTTTLRIGGMPAAAWPTVPQAGTVVSGVDNTTVNVIATTVVSNSNGDIVVSATVPNQWTASGTKTYATNCFQYPK